MVTQTYDLNMTPGGQIVNVHVSQYDIGRTITFNLLNGTVSFTPPSGTTALIEGTKPDKKGFSLAATVSGSTASFTTTQNMCAVAGPTICEFRLKQGSNNIGTANFILDVERAGLADDVDTSTSELAPYIDAAEKSAEEAEKATEEVKELAETIKEQYEDAENYATLAESWAVGGTGTRTGEDSDNAKYYAESAARSMLPGTDVSFEINSEGHLILTKTNSEGTTTADLGKVTGDGGSGSADYVFDTIAGMEAAIAAGKVDDGGTMYVREEVADGNTQLF